MIARDQPDLSREVTPDLSPAGQDDPQASPEEGPAGAKGLGRKLAGCIEEGQETVQGKQGREAGEAGRCQGMWAESQGWEGHFILSRMSLCWRILHRGLHDPIFRALSFCCYVKNRNKVK